MGLISRVSSRTYREVKKTKMLARQAIRPALRSSLRAQSGLTHNEHGGWDCKDRAEWEKYWPKIAEAQALHTAQMKQHIMVNNQGKNSEKWQKFMFMESHLVFAFTLMYGFKCLAMELM